jgi:hypothetical protein
MKNNFSEETRLLFMYCKRCWNCGNTPVELHHILGRVSNSPLNCYVICPKCHYDHGIDKNKKSAWLVQTLKFLLREQYEFTQKDLLFYIENKALYPPDAHNTLKGTKTP